METVVPVAMVSDTASNAGVGRIGSPARRDPDTMEYRAMPFVDPSVVRCLKPAPGHVVMMCGMAGSGKTTYAKALEANGFRRLSIDEYLWAHFGRFDVDYPARHYAQLQWVAEHANARQLGRLLRKRAACVLDYSFWSRAQRQRYRRFVTDAGGQVTLLYLQADPRVLRQRLRIRNRTREANAAFAVEGDMLRRFIQGFEAPDPDENAIVVVQTA